MIDEVTRWVDRLAGAVVGLGLGLAYSLVITGRLIKLGASMGVKVMQSERLSAHVSRRYQNLKVRVERLERKTGFTPGDDLEEEDGLHLGTKRAGE